MALDPFIYLGHIWQWEHHSLVLRMEEIEEVRLVSSRRNARTGTGTRAGTAPEEFHRISTVSRFPICFQSMSNPFPSWYGLLRWEVDGIGLHQTLSPEELNHNSKDRKKEALKKAHRGILKGVNLWKFDGYIWLLRWCIVGFEVVAICVFYG